MEVNGEWLALRDVYHLEEGCEMLERLAGSRPRTRVYRHHIHCARRSLAEHACLLFDTKPARLSRV